MMLLPDQESHFVSNDREKASTNLESCRGEPGKVAPVVDRNRCEAKDDCVQVCPFDVFEIRPLSKTDRSQLSLIGRLKAWAHGNKQAFVVRPDACQACQLCISACPEDALTLAPNR
jgi:4Fe-4S ferredoxin